MADRVLIVDDNPANLRLMSFLLQAAGYEIHTAVDGESALALVANVQPRIILLDLQLPGISGLEVTRRLRADPELRTLPIVAVTANAMRGDEETALAAGCDGFVTKPIDTRAFAGIVARYLAR